MPLTLERFNQIVKQVGPGPTADELAAASAKVAEYENRMRHNGDDESYAARLGITVEEFARRFDALR